MASTMGRAGVNVLSPVRMAEKTTPSDSVARTGRERSNEEDSLFGDDNKSKERQVKNWLDEVTDMPNERLPFPTSYSSQDTTKLVPDGPGMHYSRSQDLPISSFSPHKASISPRLSPRRSPRISPMRNSVESTAGSSGSNTWRSRGSLDSQPNSDEHDYSNSVSRSLSAVEDIIASPSKNNSNSSSGTNSSTAQNTNNEELLAQLEVLKMQNQMLTNRIQRAQQDSHLELERERNQRQLVVSELTQQNQQLSQQLNQTQLDAQARLAHEKEQFLLSMRQMQNKRALLDERVRKTEELAENEQKLVRMQKAQLNDSLIQLEADKESLLRKLSDNAKLIKELQIRQIGVGSSGKGGNNSGSGNGGSGKGSGTSDNSNPANDNAATNTATTASIKHSAARASPSRRALPFPSVFAFTLPSDANLNDSGKSEGSDSSGDQLSTLQHEQNQLASSLEQLSQQKQSLHTALQDTESTALYNHNQLTMQLSNEKALLELRVSKMCAEQEQMAQRLAQAERTVQEQNEQFEAQRAAEQELAQQNLSKLQQEQEQLLSKINNSRGGSQGGSFVHKPGTGADTNTDESGNGSSSSNGDTGDGQHGASKQTAADAETQRLLDQQLQQMTAAMEALKQQLLLTELASVERENALKEANKREKEELKRTVQKMKEDFLAAKMLQELEYLRETDTSAKIGSSSSKGGSGSGKGEKVSGGSANFTPIKSIPSSGRMSPLVTNNTSTGSPTAAHTSNNAITTPITINTLPGSNHGSRRNSRLKQPSPSAVGHSSAGSPALPAKHLASHRSLFDLLTMDYTTQMQMQSDGGGSTNILHTNTTNTINTTTTPNTNSKNRHAFNPHAIHTPELGALQYHRESSYHKIPLPDVTEEGEDLSGSSPRHSPMRNSNNAAPHINKNNKGASPFFSTSKTKTIMDLDSDSNSDTADEWGREGEKEVQRGSAGGDAGSGGNGSGVVKTRSKKREKGDATSSASAREAKNKIKQRLAEREKERELEKKERGKEGTPQTSRTVSPTSPVPGSTSTSNANTTMYKPNTTTTHITTQPTTTNTATTHTTNVTTTLAATSSSSSHDYSTYDLDRVSGLPAPHSAAAMNDVARLKGFAVKQMSLLQSLDQAQRQPIFYAAAYGRVEAVQYLLGTLPDQGLGVQFGLQWVRGDIHGDTPLHAAASSGCPTCTELLLTALTTQNSIKVDTGLASLADLRNNMQMTPAHLCSTAEALDVLYRFQADMEAEDIHSRTPLFIACAMNREVCAEYLIDCLDQAVSTLIIDNVNSTLNQGTSTESANPKSANSGAESKTLLSVEDKMMHTDRRGDTPLHAAACNGAVECLLLLLQHGIDPRLKNLTGLKAIDLAVRNRHKKCKDILAEYHLHYCTSGDFDSVLFLAMLEGHRRIADAAALRDGTSTGTANNNTTTTTGHKDIAEYRIIQEHPVEHGSNNTATHTAHASDASGNYGGKVRFANPFGISTEDVNTVDKDNKETSKALHKAAQSMFSLRANKSMRLQRLGPWIAYHDTSSDSVFWYNHETSRGQWEEPAEVQAIKLQQYTHAVLHGDGSGTGGGIGGGYGGGSGAGGRNGKGDIFEKTLPAKMSMRMKRHGDWIEYTTEAGRTFYYNDKDGSFQWDPPAGTGFTSHNGGEHSKHKARGANNTTTNATTANQASTSSANTATSAEQEQNAHYPWRAYIDPESGSVFWYNEVTFVSQWELPAEFEAEAAGYTEETSSTAYRQPSRSDKTRESLDLSHSLEAYNIDTQHQKNDPRHQQQQLGRRSRLRSASFEDEHVVAVWDHENDLGI